MKKYLLLLFMVSAASTSHAQLQGQPLIDSLITEIAKAKEDTNKVILLNDLSLTYYSINPDDGLKYGQQGLALAEKLNWKLGMAYAYKVIAGNYGYGKSDYARGIEYSLKSLEQFKEIGDKKGMAKILGDMGVIYWFTSDFPNALKYYFDALKIHEEGGVKNEVAATLMNIGIVYNSLEDYPKALDYMLRANKIDEAIGNKSGVAANLGNIGQLYMSLGDTSKALESNVKSLEFYETVGDKNGIARNLGNIATLYTYKKDYARSLEYNEKALDLFEQLGDKNGAAKILADIGNTYLEMAKDKGTAMALQHAKEYTARAITLSGEIGDLNTLLNNYKRLSEIQSLQDDNKGALESYKQYTLFKDSVFNMEKDKKLTETAMRYEFDKKEAATKAAQEQKDNRQRNIRNTIIAGAMLLLLLLIGLINRYRYKQKANQALAAAYDHLKATQQQLIQSEKMAAFGVMASRMAHEIQNPLNFVNNFSEMSKELVENIVTAEDAVDKKETADLLASNLEKIHHHGNRAADIITQLQQHARAGTVQQFFEDENG
ncbi:tetratricopeptide repeat-containing sensor histidine kinase [Flavihumibacter fluvii]|uniref:tetratricopeptide repeat-containing sensor histidine kinase n=1 Tax=Flavihumibacter fluvii TaxID=2838157 RepID=UPI001BDE567E|nr:tetratricopeptide repeat protein [Flavihumibacter fluvii]ULQ51756.1 tetratricopeptide repeat protein [Flavihumibacter fluvii]